MSAQAIPRRHDPESCRLTLLPKAISYILQGGRAGVFFNRRIPQGGDPGVLKDGPLWQTQSLQSPFLAQASHWLGENSPARLAAS